MKKYNVIDLFAGIGGLSYGFSKNKKFEIIMANEIEKDIAYGYQLNHPNVKVLNKDIKNIEESELLEILSGRKIDIVVGGPPCQSYSTLGKRELDDRSQLFKEYCRLLRILDPKIFIFENVKGLISMSGGNLLKEIILEFKKLDYDVKYEILNAMDYGVPQSRERIIIVGVKGKNNYKYPKKTHGENLKPYVTLKNAIGDLDRIKSGQTSNKYIGEIDNEFLKFVRDTENLTEHIVPKNNENMIKIMETLKEGQDKNDLPESIRPKSGYGNTYAKLWWNKPSTTITRNFSTPSSSRCIHPIDSRPLSTREGARLQSFPDSYIFYGNSSLKKLEIGNAVPPLLSLKLVEEIEKILEE